MKKILIALILFTSITNIYAEKLEKVTISEFKGLLDRLPDYHEKFPAWFSPFLQNVFISY